MWRSMPEIVLSGEYVGGDHKSEGSRPQPPVAVSRVRRGRQIGRQRFASSSTSAFLILRDLAPYWRDWLARSTSSAVASDSWHSSRTALSEAVESCGERVAVMRSIPEKKSASGFR